MTGGAATAPRAAAAAAAVERTADMRAAVIRGPRSASTVAQPRPEPEAGSVLLQLEGSGVCASNLPVWEGREWFTYPQEPGAPGHEGWGRIAALGEGVSGLAVGQRVAALSYHAYAEYDVANAAAVVPLPPELDDLPLPGEPLGCAANVFARSDVRPGMTVAVVGIGFLGAMLTRLAAHAGARVIAISRRPFALDVARAMGASETIPMVDHGHILAEVDRLTAGTRCERVIEAVGLQWPLDLAGAITADRGRLMIAGFHQDGPRQVDMQSWNWRGLDVINAHEREPAVYVSGMREAVQLVRSGVLDLRPLLTHEFPLDQLDAALEVTRLRPDGFLKALVTT